MKRSFKRNQNKENSSRRKREVVLEKKIANRPELKGRRKHRNGGENENGEEGRKRK